MFGRLLHGTIRIGPVFAAEPLSQVADTHVTFEPGARANWPTYLLGQTLIVTFGGGWIQCEGAPAEDIHAGDVVCFTPDKRHWHGASANRALSHIAAQDRWRGGVAQPVSAADYRRE